MTIIRDAETEEVVGRICQCRQGYYGVETTPPTLGGVMVTSILPTKRQAQNELYADLLNIMIENTGARKSIPDGMVRIGRDKKDDKSIVEVWI